MCVRGGIIVTLPMHCKEKWLGNKNDPTLRKCSNYSENHTSSFRGCPVYKGQPIIHSSLNILYSQTYQRYQLPLQCSLSPSDVGRGQKQELTETEELRTQLPMLKLKDFSIFVKNFQPTSKLTLSKSTKNLLNDLMA